MTRKNHLMFLLMFVVFISACQKPQAEKTDFELGKSLYAVHCASCHGVKGDGQGPVASYLFPKPRDLTSGVFKYRTTRGPIPSDIDILQTLKKGIPGSSMPGWDLLGTKEWGLILAYIKSFSPRFQEAQPGASFEVPPEPKVTLKSIQEGETLFAEKGCVGCHGADGRGEGSVAMHLKDVWGDRVLPRDLKKGLLKWGNTPKDLYRTLALGIPGTPMPSYENTFTPDQLWSLVHYIQSIKQPLPEGYNPSDPKRMLLSAKKIEGNIPLDYQNPAWSTAKEVPVYLKPLWYEGDLIEWLMVKALSNGSEFAIQISWEDDQANNTPTQQDGVAVQFPLKTINNPSELPYLGMGNPSNEVNIWEWRGDRFAEALATGVGTLQFKSLSDTEVTGQAVYDQGVWHVIFKRSIRPSDHDDAPLSKVGYISFALWDEDVPKHAGPESFSEWMIYELLADH